MDIPQKRSASTIKILNLVQDVMYVKKQNDVYKKMIEANIIIFALLVYFYTFNGSMKLLIDRTFAIEKTDVIEKAYHMTKEIKINE